MLGRLDGLLGRNISVQNLGESHGCSDTDNGSESEHQTNHDTGKVGSKNSVDDDEDLLILQLTEAHVNTSWEEPDEHIQIEEESWPGSRLVLGDGGDDGNMNLGVASVPERVETSTPWGDGAGDGEQNKTTEGDNEDDQDQTAEQCLELLARDLSTDPFNECNDLEKTENTERSHVIAAPDWQETDEWNLHTCKRTETIPGGVADVQSGAVSAHADEHESVKGQQVGDEDVSTPCRHHVSVEKGSQSTPGDGTQLQTLDPQVEGKDEQEDGDGLVVVTTCNGTGDIAWSNAHECCGK